MHSTGTTAQERAIVGVYENSATVDFSVTRDQTVAWHRSTFGAEVTRVVLDEAM